MKLPPPPQARSLHKREGLARGGRVRGARTRRRSRALHCRTAGTSHNPPSVPYGLQELRRDVRFWLDVGPATRLMLFSITSVDIPRCADTRRRSGRAGTASGFGRLTHDARVAPCGGPGTGSFSQCSEPVDPSAGGEGISGARGRSGARESVRHAASQAVRQIP